MRGCCRKFSTPSGRNSSMTNRYTYVTDECVRIAGAQPFPAAGIHTFRAVIRKHPVKIIRLVISLHIPSPDTGPGYIIRIRTHPFHIHARGNIVSGIRSEISAFQLQPIIACKQAVQLNTCANLTGNVIFWFQIKVRYPVIGFTLAVKCTSSLYISAIVGHGMQRIWSRTSSASLSVRLKSPPLGTGVRLSVLRHGD